MLRIGNLDGMGDVGLRSDGYIWVWAALGTPVIYAPYTIHGTPRRGVGSIGVPRAITNSSKTIPSTPHTLW